MTGEHGFDELVRIVAVLRGPGGCPWDREQSHMSLRPNMIEEAYEAVAAIEAHDDAHLCEELGDVLLQVVLHAQMGAEDGTFTLDDAIHGITEKLRRRHPHIFGDVAAGSAEEVIHRWDRIKQQEKADAAILEGVPEHLPALMYAQKVSRKAAAAGFDWVTVADVWDKFHEEIDELKAAEKGTPEVAEEIGDLLFTAVNLSRRLGVDAESALRDASAKFKRRFEDMERSAEAAGEELAGMDLQRMEGLWRQAKDRERTE